MDLPAVNYGWATAAVIALLLAAAIYHAHAEAQRIKAARIERLRKAVWDEMHAVGEAARAGDAGRMALHDARLRLVEDELRRARQG